MTWNVMTCVDEYTQNVDRQLAHRCFTTGTVRLTVNTIVSPPEQDKQYDNSAADTAAANNTTTNTITAGAAAVLTNT